MRSGRDTAQLQADAARYGVILEPHHLAAVDCKVWVELWPVVMLFQRSQTQWRATSSGVIGLDYGVVLGPLAAVLGIDVNAQLLDDLQTMELHAREKINRKARN